MSLSEPVTFSTLQTGKSCLLLSFHSDVSKISHTELDFRFLAVVDGLCQVFLRDGGICALRRLPRYFDLSFWKKYRTSLEQIDDDVLSDKLLKRAFIEFCGKNLVIYNFKFIAVLLMFRAAPKGR